MKKRILYLSQLYPYPPNGGGKIKTLATLKTLAKKYEICAVFVSETNPKKNEILELTKLGIKVKVFYHPEVLDSVKDDLPNLFRNFLRFRPHYLFQYTHISAFPFINKLINIFRPDIIHIDHINMAQYLPDKKNEIWILEHHNVEFYLYWTRFINSRRLTRKAYLLVEMILTYLFENNTIRKFDHVFAISNTEEQRIKNIFKIKNVSTQTLVYKSKKLTHIPVKNPYLLFIGNVTWPPNEDAVEWFIKSMFPKILKKLPNAEFHIVGKRHKILEFHLPKNKNIIFHGMKKSLTQYLKKADVFVLPFRMGGGMRIKSLTAMSAGLPVVTTPLGTEGLKVKNKLNCLICKNPRDFSSKVINIIKDKKLNARLRINSRKYVEINHGEIKNMEFLRKYANIIQKFS